VRDCSCSSSRIIFQPSRAVLPTTAFVVIYFGRSSATLSSTTPPLRLHLQANSTCIVMFVCLFIMFCEYMFSYYLFLFILLCSTSSMLELHVVVAAIVMFNILELTMEIVANNPRFLLSLNTITSTTHGSYIT
jgi:hypothetical protein